MSEEEVKKAKARCWVLTLHLNEKHNTIASRVEQLKRMPDWLKYIRYGVEICPTTGKEHLQCWCECWNPVRWTQFKSYIGDSYRAPMFGRLMDNEAYCAKEGEYHDLGDKPMQGRRTDLIGTKRRLDQISAGENINDVAREEPHFGSVMKYAKSMQGYVDNVRKHQIKGDHSAPDVIYIYGPPGSGKTRYVRELEPNVYDVPASDGYKWKDGYSLEPAVLFDNMEPKQIQNNAQFLKEIDRYPVQSPIKGGFTWWKPKRIYITSIFSPEIMKTYFKDPMEFTRRITSVKRFESI